MWRRTRGQLCEAGGVEKKQRAAALAINSGAALLRLF
jgi:hypothetical protein